MKSSILTLCLVALPLMGSAVSMSAGSGELEANALKGAAEISVGRIHERIVRERLGIGELEKAMLSDPGRFASREEAVKECEKLYLEIANAEYERKCKAVLTELAGAQGIETVFGTNGFESVGLGEESVRKISEGVFKTAFEDERRQACENQAKGIVCDVKPPIVELDEGNDDKVKSFMVERIAARQKSPVFEENREIISEKIVAPVIEGARKEKERQEKYVRGAAKSEAYAPSALAAELTAKLCENVRSRAAKAENPAFAFEVFPSVTNRTLATAVENRVIRRFADEVGETDLKVDKSEVVRELSDNAALHRKAEESKTIFKTQAGARVLAAAMAAEVGEAPEKERTELKEFLEKKSGSKEVSLAVSRKVDAAAVAVWREARTEAVEREFAQKWPTLADETWYPNAQLADDTVARSDYGEAVAKWRELGVTELSGDREVFEETETKTDEGVRKAFELARSAIAEQTRIVDTEHPTVLAEARRRKDSFFSRTPDLNGIVGLLTEAVRERWTETKDKVLWGEGEKPANAAEQHSELFPSVKKRIELVAKSILEEMQEPEEKPEEPPKEESDSESESEEELLKISIMVEKSSDGVKVTLSSGGKTVAERESKAAMGEFRETMKYIAEKLGGEVLKLK